MCMKLMDSIAAIHQTEPPGQALTREVWHWRLAQYQWRSFWMGVGGFSADLVPVSIQAKSV